MGSFFAHATALIERGSRIGKGTRIWAYAHVLEKAAIGERCNIGDHVFIESGVHLGDDVTVKNGVQLWEGITVGKGVFIGAGVTFTNHKQPRAFIKRPKSAWFEKTRLQEGCTLGAGAVLLCGLTVGRYAFVAAGSLVTRNVPDFALVLGHPAAFRSWCCYCGRPLIFRGEQSRCTACRERFILNSRRNGVRPLRPRRDIQSLLNRRYKKIRLA